MDVVGAVELVDVREAAAIAHRDPETIRRWVRQGRLAARRRGNRLLLLSADVERVAGVQGSRPVMTLADWRTHVARARASSGASRSSTAADLVLDDRAER